MSKLVTRSACLVPECSPSGQTYIGRKLATTPKDFNITLRSAHAATLVQRHPQRVLHSVWMCRTARCSVAAVQSPSGTARPLTTQVQAVIVGDDMMESRTTRSTRAPRGPSTAPPCSSAAASCTRSRSRPRRRGAGMTPTPRAAAARPRPRRLRCARRCDMEICLEINVKVHLDVP